MNNGNKKENVFSQMFKKIYSNFKQKNQKDHLNVQFNKINENFSKLKNEEVDIQNAILPLQKHILPGSFNKGRSLSQQVGIQYLKLMQN